jgi:anti-sigma B factor antagonist
MWNPFARHHRTAVESQAGPSPIQESARAAVPSSIAEVEIVGGVAIGTFTVTELTRDGGVESLCALLESLYESGARHIVLDIQNVQHMDSACLGVLVESLNQLTARGGRIALANAAHSVQYLFRLTRLDRVFPICGDVMAALNSVERPAGRLAREE